MASTPDSGRWADKELFTTGEAAEVCGVSQQTIIRCFDAGRLDGFRVPGSRFRRIPRASLIAFMKSNNIDPAPLIGRHRRILLLLNPASAHVKALRARLESDPHNTVHAARNAFDGGACAATLNPAVAVIDGDMPGLDPAAAVKAICELSGGRPEVVVLISDATPPRVRELIAAGAREVLPNSIGTETLADRIADLIDR